MAIVPGATVTQAYEGPGLSQHRGIDLGAPAGSPIYATHAGRVIRADYDTNLPSFGWHVRVQAGSRTFIYGHMRKAPDVRVGQDVTAGRKLGEVGSTGTSTGNHLHYEVREDGKVVNPAPYMSGGGSTGGKPAEETSGGVEWIWIPGLGRVPVPVDGVKAGADAVGGVVSGIDAVGSFFGALGQRATWVRVLQVVGGAALVIGGVVIVGKGVIADVAVSALPGGGALKAMTK